MKDGACKGRGRGTAAAISAGVALLIAVPVAFRQGLSASLPFGENCRYLSDGFFVAGLLLTGIGLLTVIATTGIFDIFAYAMRSLLVLFSPLKRPGTMPAFYDFKLARAEKRRPPQRTLLYVGLACLGLSLLFLALYYA